MAVGNERASTHRQSPDWRFQLQRHACEMTSCDFNYFAVGKKVFVQGNANLLTSLATEGGSVHISMTCSTPRPGFTVFSEGQDTDKVLDIYTGVCFSCSPSSFLKDLSQVVFLLTTTTKFP